MKILFNLFLGVLTLWCLFNVAYSETVQLSIFYAVLALVNFNTTIRFNS